MPEQIYYLVCFIVDKMAYTFRPEGFQTALLEEEEEFYLEGDNDNVSLLADAIKKEAIVSGWDVDSVTVALVPCYDADIGNHYKVTTYSKRKA